MTKFLSTTAFAAISTVLMAGPSAAFGFDHDWGFFDRPEPRVQVFDFRRVEQRVFTRPASRSRFGRFSLCDEIGDCREVLISRRGFPSRRSFDAGYDY